MSARKLAKAIRRSAHDVADRKQETMVGVIRTIKPLRVELTESGMGLDDDDISMGQGVRRYDKDKGLKAGDSLVLTPLRSGDWIAQEVLSEHEPAVNLEASAKKPKITGSREGNAALKDLLKTLDELGVIKDETTA